MSLIAKKQITSASNPLIKELRLIASSSSARSKEGKSLIEGSTICEMYLESFGVPLICIVTEDNTNDHIKNIVDKCGKLHGRIVEVPRRLYESFSGLENGEGITFYIKTPIVNAVEPITESALIIDRIQDPGNLGTILRSAVAAGINSVYCSKGTVSLWSPKVIRSAMGAHFGLKMYEMVNLKEVLSSAKVVTVATSSHAKKTIYEADLSRQIAWLIGNEGQGADPDLIKLCKETVKIPHKGNIESLNVSIATSICLFEQNRQIDEQI